MNKRTKSTNSGRKSQKGKWGHIGAPPKAMRFPARPFVMAGVFAFNPKLCELTVRKNVEKAVADGTLVSLKPIPQKGGAVGRPKSRFVLKTAFDASKMEVLPIRSMTTPVMTTKPSDAQTIPFRPVTVEQPVTETLAEAMAVPVVSLPTTEAATFRVCPDDMTPDPVVAPL